MAGGPREGAERCQISRTPPPPGPDPERGEPGPRAGRAEAKADAKASAARAKAIRPWYRKKRFILLGAVAIIAVIAIVANSGSDSDTDTASNGNGNGEAAEGDNDVSTGLGSQDAVDDVEVTDCGLEPDLGWATATVTITNNSSGRSDYFVTVAFETDDGATRTDEGLASASNLEPDQVTEVDAPTATEAPENVECRIVEVQRTASN